MTTKGKHDKHPPLQRPKIGKYHRAEWAIYGTTCSGIERIYRSVLIAATNCRILYIDADHDPNSSEYSRRSGTKKMISSHSTTWNTFDDRLNDFAVDAAIVNGNHYPAARQIVVIDHAKKESLLRRIDQLTKIDLILTDDPAEIYDFVEAKMTDSTQILGKQDIDGLVRYITAQIEISTPELKAVVLAGGKSQRMGTDKSQIKYHQDLTQEDWLLSLLRSKEIPAYLSKSYNHLPSEKNEEVIRDRFVDLGPAGAIMSAMMTDPDAAWLVLAVDLPLITPEAIGRLIAQRDTSAYATAYQVDKGSFPEPLVAIYEPRAYQRFLQFLSLGYACPRKVLINSTTHTILPHDTSVLTNVNTPLERKQISDRL